MISLDLPKPVSTNAMYRRAKTRVYASPEYRLWRLNAGWAWQQQRRRIASLPKITGPYTFRLLLSSKKRRGDLDNFLKGPLDFCVSVGLTPDDRLCDKPSAEWSDEIPEGMCRVIIEPVQQEAA